MRRFKVQYSQVLEYEVEAQDLDDAARQVSADIKYDDKGYNKVLQIVEVGVPILGPACPDCEAEKRPASRIFQHWPLPKKERKSTSRKIVVDGGSAA
jgi:hypothetical protein